MLKNVNFDTNVIKFVFNMVLTKDFTAKQSI